MDVLPSDDVEWLIPCPPCLDALEGLRPEHDCLGWLDGFCCCACPDLWEE